MIIGVIGLVAALLTVIPAVFAALAVLAAVLSGAAVLLVAGVLAGKGILAGMVLGFIAYRAFRKARMAERTE